MPDEDQEEAHVPLGIHLTALYSLTAPKCPLIIPLISRFSFAVENARGSRNLFSIPLAFRRRNLRNVRRLELHLNH